MAKPETLSASAARRIAIGAQGLAGARPATPAGQRQLLALIRKLGLHQIDSVNVLARAHYLPAFSRLGPYDRALLDDLAWGRKSKRPLFEYWAHEASLVPVETQPLLRWRMARAERGEGLWSSLRHFATEHRPAIEAVIARIGAEGPLSAAELGSGGTTGWWEWSESKRILEYLFWSGRVTTATRRGAFERVYDLSERVLPPDILNLPTPSLAEAQRALIAQGAKAHGIATARDLRDYFRLSPGDAAPRIAELAEEGVLLPVAVEGWGEAAWLHRDARRPRRAEGRALLSPFDPLVWERSRTERLFGMRYRIEIYTPAEKRVHGYYVLPFLLGDRLAARVDLKADRKARLLRVQAAHAEPGPAEDLPDRLAEELGRVSRWLGLESILVAPRGDLAPALAAAIRS